MQGRKGFPCGLYCSLLEPALLLRIDALATNSDRLAFGANPGWCHPIPPQAWRLQVLPSSAIGVVQPDVQMTMLELRGHDA
jgi:hypothetical protein